MVGSAVLRSSLRSPCLVPIWTLEALNYVVHVLWRPVSWNLRSQTAGYTLWALQLACFFRCQLVPAPEVSDEWLERAAAGLEPASICPRTGKMLPQRARHVRRAGVVILGFDHVSTWQLPLPCVRARVRAPNPHMPTVGTTSAYSRARSIASGLARPSACTTASTLCFL